MVGRAQRAILACVLVVVAGCAGTTPTPQIVYVTPEPTLAVTDVTQSPTSAATPTPTPTPAATPTPTPSPTPAREIDPTADLKIAAPYELMPLDPVQAAMFEAGVEKALGALAGIMRVGARQAVKGGEMAAVVLVMQLPDMESITGQPEFLDAMAGGMGGKVTKTTISDVPVRLVASATQNVVLYQRGDGVVMALAPTMSEAKAVTTALIKGSK